MSISISLDGLSIGSMNNIEDYLVNNPNVADNSNYDWTKRRYTKLDKIFTLYGDTNKPSDYPKDLYITYSDKHRILFQIIYYGVYIKRYVAYIKKFNKGEQCLLPLY